MKLSVRLFAILRERAGTESVEIEVPEGSTVADAIEALRRQPGLDELEAMPLRLAVNREYADPAEPVEAGDELAAIPPVSGGGPDAAETEQVTARVTSEPLSLDSLARAVGRPSAGAVVTFQGTTRDVDSLDYEAYPEMAEARIASILADCVSSYGLEAAAAEHRIGTVPLGEPSVIVAVAAAHRAEAFAGAREAIDRIKSEAPIWKREVEGGSARWVEGTPP
jgi:MoaE-MoaD fusion protein